MRFAHWIVVLMFVASFIAAALTNALVWLAAYAALGRRAEMAVFVVPSMLTAFCLAAYGFGAIGLIRWIDRDRMRNTIVGRRR